MAICDKMDSYVIQDLIDYCDKVLFEIFKGKYKKPFNFFILFYIIEL